MSILNQLVSVYNFEPNIVIIVSGLLVTCAAVKFIYNNWPTREPNPKNESEADLPTSSSVRPRQPADVEESKNTPGYTAQSFYGVSPARHIDQVKLAFKSITGVTTCEFYETKFFFRDTQFLIDLDGRATFQIAPDISGSTEHKIIDVILTRAIRRHVVEQRIFYNQMYLKDLNKAPSAEQTDKRFNDMFEMLSKKIWGSVPTGPGISEDNIINYKKQHARNLLISAEIYRTCEDPRLRQTLYDHLLNDISKSFKPGIRT